MIGIIVLAGGQGRRMGGQDKGWCVYQNRSCVEQLLEQLQAQINALPLSQASGGAPTFKIFISANRNLSKYHALGFDVITDEREDYCGPLAGIEAVVHYQATLENLKGVQPIKRWITCPVDSPKLPQNYLNKMLSVTPQQLAYAQQQGRKHFAHLSIPAVQAESVSAYLHREQRSIKGWLFQPAFERYLVAVPFECASSNLLNLNTLNSNRTLKPNNA
ncbi:MAG: NTP transferase domain-containing protein [Thiotrichales bacterium]|nr:NTP transferase domain-containing protein [Thiotrichales bacterium]